MIVLIIQTLVSFFNQISVVVHNRNLPRSKDRRALFLFVKFVVLNRKAFRQLPENFRSLLESIHPLDQTRLIIFVQKLIVEMFELAGLALIAWPIPRKRSKQRHNQQNQRSIPFLKQISPLVRLDDGIVPLLLARFYSTAAVFFAASSHPT